MSLETFINKINELSYFLDYSIITVPILFVLSKWKKFSGITQIALNILRYTIIIVAFLNLIFWVDLILDIFWFKGYEQLAYISEQTKFYNRAFGNYWFAYLSMIIGNTILPLFLFINCFGRSFLWVFIFVFFFKFGVYMERWIIIFSSYKIGGLDAYWVTNYGIPILLWIVQSIVYATGLLGVSHVILKLKNSKLYSNKVTNRNAKTKNN